MNRGEIVSKAFVLIAFLLSIFLLTGVAHAIKSISATAIPFIENTGQIKDESVRYYAKTLGGTVFITKGGEIVYLLPKFEGKTRTNLWLIKENFIGENIAEVKGLGRAVTKVNYFIGNDPTKWRKDIPTFDLVSLGDIYGGVEVKLKAYGNTVEKLFYIKPEADPSIIKIKVEGAKSIKVGKEGGLEFETDLGTVKYTKPMAYQEIDGKRKFVEVAYVVKEDRYSFKVGEYDEKKQLVIDPILQSTYLGGSGEDNSFSITTGSDGSVYVGGTTCSTNLPGAAGGVQPSSNGWPCDGFISKLSSDLTTILQSTYLGGDDGDDVVYSIAIGSDGSVYVGGYTTSTNFPGTSGGAQSSYGGAGADDGFVSKLNSDLTILSQSTYLGGSRDDLGLSIAISSDGSVYVAGQTTSTNFPGTSGGVQPSFVGPLPDAFVSKLSSDIKTILQSTYLGGDRVDCVYSIAIGSDGSVYVGGNTYSANFPGTSGGAQSSYGGGAGDGFVSKLNSDLTILSQSTYLGGSRDDLGLSIAISSDGSVYVAGQTYSANLPATSGGAQPSSAGVWDVFVSKLSSALTTFVQSTYLGGNDYDRISLSSIAIGSDGSVYVGGYTTSTNFPGTLNGAQSSYGGTDDGFVSKLNSELTILSQSTYLGGSSFDGVSSIALGTDGSVYVIGPTDSQIFPKTEGGTQPSYGGARDAFVSKIDSSLTSDQCTLEICDGLDNDCDGQIDEEVVITFYRDGDGDSYGDPANTTQSCTQPSGFAANALDCDDSNAAIYPGATEICNNKDDDCDGSIDEGLIITFYKDEDGDGYGDPNNSIEACIKPAGYAENNLDCEPDYGGAYPGAPEVCNKIDDNCDGQIDEGVATTYYADRDGDDYGDPNESIQACRKTLGYAENNLDCAPWEGYIYPGAPETCNNRDDDCDGEIDDGLSFITYYRDSDFDGYGDPNNSKQACEKPVGWVTNNLDCEPGSHNVHPGADEICNDVDDDCDGEIDDGLSFITYYDDSDHDGYGDPNNSIQACAQPTGYVTNNLDCGPGNGYIHPGATETCNNLDDNCNGEIDEGLLHTYYRDVDGDGYGYYREPEQACTKPVGYAENNLDCSPWDVLAYPGAPEVCNNLDDDCDGEIDEGVLPLFTYYADFDLDGYGDPNNSIQACAQPTRYVTNNLDCKPLNHGIHPGATEKCNRADDNCDGQIDEGTTCAFIHVPMDKPTIQAGIDAASPGQIVIVADGIWKGQGNKDLNLRGKAITVKSENGPANCIIDCENEGRGFLIGVSSDSIVDGFTIINGRTDVGGGIYIELSAPTIKNCIIRSNTATNKGGGIFMISSGDREDHPIIDSCIISENTATEDGGGIHGENISPIISNSKIINNASSVWGGGISIRLPLGVGEIYGDIVISKCTISGNSAYLGGGGIFTYRGAATIIDSTISNNISCKGGGLHSLSLNNIVRCNITENKASSGGGIYANYSTSITNSTISRNEALSVPPGHHFCGNFSYVEGAGILINQEDPREDRIDSITIKNCTITDNIAESGGLEGGGMLFYYWLHPIIMNSIIWGNVPDAIGIVPGFYTESSTGRRIFIASAEPTVRYSDVEGGYAGTGNIDIDPEFVLFHGSYHLTEASPCIDRGTSAGTPPDDIDGNSRPQGQGYDIGSDEYVSDNDGDGIPDIVEINTGTDPYDDDTDDDGLLDGPGSGEDTNANGVVDPGETDPRNPDSDGDGLQDGIEKGLTEPEGFDTDMTIFKADADPSTTTDPLNPDTDGDGTLDGNDVCPNDPNKIQPGICCCGVADTDSDSDGAMDCNDGCPSDPNKTQPGVCGCGKADTDSDNDGAADCNDGCPNDSNKINPGICGCGSADIDADNDGSYQCNDCDDADAAMYPRATEICDGKDNNCNDSVDEGVMTVFYQDADGDGYGNSSSSTPSCTQPAGYVTNNADCNDSNPAIKPGATEVCNSADDDCDGNIDEGDVCHVTYTFYGFFNPVDNPPNLNKANSGQTIPVKWRITDANGVPISDSMSFKSLKSYIVSCDNYSGLPTDAIEEYSTGSSGLQYLGDGNWQFNWKTAKTYAGQCRTMVLTLGDESTHTANFKFK